VAAARVTTSGAGLRLTVGEPERRWRQTLWRCRRFECASLPLDTYAGDGRREMLAVAGDGRVLVVRADRVVLLQTPFPQPAV
jgi:hypothetical protein